MVEAAKKQEAAKLAAEAARAAEDAKVQRAAVAEPSVVKRAKKAAAMHDKASAIFKKMEEDSALKQRVQAKLREVS